MQASLIANCVFNAFLCFTAVTFNIVTIIALRKPLAIPSAVKTLLISLTVSDLGVGLLVHPLYITNFVMAIKQNTQTLTFEITLSFSEATVIFFSLCLFLWCCSSSRRQILGCLSPSQIQGTSDLQARCYRCDLDLDHKCDCDVAVQMEFEKCFLDYFSSCRQRLLPNHSLVLFQDLLSCTSPQQSNSCPASTSSTE